MTNFREKSTAADYTEAEVAEINELEEYLALIDNFCPNILASRPCVDVKISREDC